MPTGKEYAQEAYKIYSLTPKAGYIYGYMNTLWTKDLQNALEKKYHSDPNRYEDLQKGVQYGSKWIGHKVWDCSGLTKDCGRRVGITTYHHGSNSSWRSDCAYQGAKTAGMKLPPGAWVYTGDSSNRGHIGIVFDDEWVIEAQGTINGVIKSKLSNTKWKWWGLGKGLSFEFIPGKGKVDGKPVETVVDTKTATGSSTGKIPTYSTIRRGDRGELVTQCQRLLSKAGSNLEIDGIFGPGTQSAVRAFQKKNGLTVDGIVGPQTWGALLKLV